MSTTSGMDKLWFIHQEDVITVETNEYCFIQQHGCVSQTKLNERSQDTSNLICFMLTFKNEQNKSMMLQNACVLSCIRLFPTPSTVSTVACQASLSTEFSRQEYWSGLPSPTPGDLLDAGIEPRSLVSPALAGRFFTTSATLGGHTKTLICCRVTGYVPCDYLHSFFSDHVSGLNFL